MKIKQMKNNILFYREEAAKYLGVQFATMKVWATERPTRIPYIRVGRKVQYFKEDLDNYIKSRRVCYK